MMNSLISIIVPVYNGEKYISKCIESLINQTYNNIEIIIINDGSVDKTKTICEQFAHKDGRIILINTENKGVSHARNIGIEKAKGDYIGFVDSDDYVELEMYEILIKNAQENYADVSICGWTNFEKREENKDKIYICDRNNDAIRMLFYSYDINGFLWNKLYRRDIIYSNKKEFEKIDDDIKILEDLLYNYNLFKRCTRFVYTTKKLYHYIINSSSVLNSKFSQKNATALKAIKMIIDDIKIQNTCVHEDLKVKLEYEFSCLYYKSIYLLKEERDNTKKKYQRDEKDFYNDIIKSKKISILKKIRVFLAKNIPFIVFKK